MDRDFRFFFVLRLKVFNKGAFSNGIRLLYTEQFEARKTAIGSPIDFISYIIVINFFFF